MKTAFEPTNTGTSFLMPKIKLVISGSLVEWYEYDDCPLNLSFDTPKSYGNKKGYQYSPEHNFRTTKKTLERLVCCNPKMEKFLTLTFAENLQDINLANKYFNNFIHRLRRQYPNFQYVGVPERQKRGAIHYHVLCHLPYVPVSRIEKIWGLGFVRLNRTDRVKSLASYMSKYLGKDLFDGQLKHKKKFFCSEELERPIIFYDEDAQRKINSFYLITKVYQTEFTIPYIGTMKYVQYKNDDKLFNDEYYAPVPATCRNAGTPAYGTIGLHPLKESIDGTDIKNNSPAEHTTCYDVVKLPLENL